MKAYAILAVLALIACEAEMATPNTPVQDNFDTDNATLLKEGPMTGCGGHTVSATVKLYEQSGKNYVYFEMLNSQNGPDLKVYLSKDANATQYVRLGVLKSTMGNQSYEVPAMTDLGQYPVVHIWCERFSVCFGIAEPM
jgi:hypothetical protein